MKCPHCSVNFHENWATGSIEQKLLGKVEAAGTTWTYRIAVCPACDKETIELSPPQGRIVLLSDRPWRQVYPVGSK